MPLTAVKNEPATRKICRSPLHKGQRWLWVGEFRVTKWSDDGSKPVTLHSYCRTCERMRYRIERKGKPVRSNRKRRKRHKPVRRIAVVPHNHRSRKGEERLPTHPIKDAIAHQVLLIGVEMASIKTSTGRDILHGIIEGTLPTVNLEQLDRILTGLDCTELLAVHYPQEE